MLLCRILLVFIFLEINCIFGLERTKLKTNEVNLNFLRSEAGQNSNVNSQGFPALPSNNNINRAQTGSVQELVNFFSNQGKGTASTAKPLSYSSVLSGSKQNQQTVSHSADPVKTGDTKRAGNDKINPPSAVNNPHTKVEPNKHHQTSPEGHKNGETVRTNKDNIQNPTITAKPTTKPTFSQVLSDMNKGPMGTHTDSSNNRGKLPSMPTSIATGMPVLPSTILSRPGFTQVNINPPTDIELQTLSEDLLRKDRNNVAKLITVNYQQKTTADSKEDKAPLPLFTIPPSVFNSPTIQKFLPLLDNYERDTLVNEYVTPQERNEEHAFMDAIMQTQVIRQLMTFLNDKGYVTRDPMQQREFLKAIWFNLYSRGKGKISSSGFEHVFVSELKNNAVSGLHNWLYFAIEESSSRVNYLGYLKYNQFIDKGAIVKLHFNQQGVDKPVGTMFVGTSPELEIALYSLCFITRADRDCPLKLGGKTVGIVTHTFRYRSKNMIGSAYPTVV